MGNRSTKKSLRNLEEWEPTASERDIQYQLLRVAVETRDKIESIRSIITFLFVLWVIGVIIVILVNAANAASSY